MAGAAARPAALVMARAPRPGHCKTRLEPLLGPEGCARLQAGLVERTVAWARAVALGAAFLAYDPPDAEAELRALAPDDVTLFAQVPGDLGARLTAAVDTVLARHAGPLLVVGADLPALGDYHAAAALDDFAAGCEVVLGQGFDGSYYLVGLSAPRPEVFSLTPEAWGGEDVFMLTLRAAADAGLSAGFLRPERDLGTPADARALLADPLLDPGLAALLRPAADAP